MKLVSIILATHNGQLDYLRQALDSVLAQTYTNWELIIIDDASTQSVEFVKERDQRVRYVRNDTCLGLTKSLNRGIALARGEYIARLDDDDIWLDASKLTKQVAFLEAHPDVALCGTQHVIIDETGHELFRLHLGVTDQEIRERLLTGNQFVHSGVCLRASALHQVGDYNEHLRYAQDYELWLRLGTAFKLANLDEYMVAKRVVKTSVTNKHHRWQWWLAFTTAQAYRRQYPGWHQAWPVYVREGFLNSIPKNWFQTLSAWRRGKGA